MNIVQKDPRIETAAKALGVSALTPKGRAEFDWEKDFSENEREDYRRTAVIVMGAIGIL